MATNAVARVLTELMQAPSEADASRALASATLRVEGDAVHVDHEVYRCIPTRAARVSLLRRAGSLGPRTIMLHVHVGDERTHRGRIAFDLPRRLLRVVGVTRIAEPGVRRADGGWVHLFFDEEALRDEIASAGLAIERRQGSTFVLAVAPDRAPGEVAEPFGKEVVAVLGVLRKVERERRERSPEEAVASARRRGEGASLRGPIGRARLLRAIGWVDAAMPGGGNCYRRTLLELSLDAGAARETIVFGLDVGRTGHVAFEGREDRTFDVAYAIGPRPAGSPRSRA